ncbi:MAG: carbohydrate kinase family protein [Chloroflexota bacterium]|nr:MAG: hypothetical protein DIU68_09230 [Chloroflexota bacterium]
MTDFFDFAGVGGLSYDIVLQVDHLPATDSKLPGRLLGFLPGGFIANATCAAARLGLRAGFAGWIGGDDQGVMLRDDFERFGVDVGGLTVVAGEATPFTVILVAGDERAIVIPDSPLYHLPPEDRQLEMARQARQVLTYPRDAAWCQQIAAAARANGGVLALDVERMPAMAATREALALADVLFLADASVREQDWATARSLSFGRWVIVTAGREGAYGFVDGSGPLHQPAYPAAAIDTTGAGDCFHAALLAARHWGDSLPEALRFAAAAAAIKVESVGARGGLPTREQVYARLEHHG